MADYLDAAEARRAWTSWWAAGSPTTTIPTTSRSASSIRRTATAGPSISSPEADRILEEARVEEPRRPSRGALPAIRAAPPRRGRPHPALPRDRLPYRGPARARRRALRSTPPFVNYGEIGEGPRGAGRPRAAVGGGVLHVPIAGVVEHAGPAPWPTRRAGGAVGNVFETLTRDVEGGGSSPGSPPRSTPRRAARASGSACGAACASTTARTLTARDVRYSFERLLQNAEERAAGSSRPSAGRSALLDGEIPRPRRASRSSRPPSSSIELEKPVSFFPASISYAGRWPSCPRGPSASGDHWRQGCVGTGPFRVVRFEPGKRLELSGTRSTGARASRRAEGLVFRFGVSPEEISRSSWRAGSRSPRTSFRPTPRAPPRPPLSRRATARARASRRTSSPSTSSEVPSADAGAPPPDRGAVSTPRRSSAGRSASSRFPRAG